MNYTTTQRKKATTRSFIRANAHRRSYSRHCWVSAIGHHTRGTLTGRASPKKTGESVKHPLLLTASILPHIYVILSFQQHRGPTHSLFTITMLTIPYSFFNRETANIFTAWLHTLSGRLLHRRNTTLWAFSATWESTIDKR